MKQRAILAFGLLLATAVSAQPAEPVVIAPLALDVTDAESGVVLSDVLVVVSHPLFVEDGWNPHEGVYYEQSGDLLIAEAVTGADGKAQFPAMQAARPSSEQLLEDGAPRLLLFKPGYLPRLLDDARGTRGDRGVRPVPAKLDSSWHGKTVTLERASEPFGINQADMMMMFMKGLYSGPEPNCRWRQMPKLHQRLETAAAGNVEIEKQLDWLRRTNPCGYRGASALQWQDTGGQMELHVALSSMEQGESVTTTVPRDGRVVVQAGNGGNGGSASGVLFIRRGDNKKREQLRVDGKPASTELPNVKAGETITVDFLDFGGNRIRQGAIGIEN